jgi:hypothetical protein
MILPALLLHVLLPAAGTSCGAGVLSEWTDIDLINSGDNTDPGNSTTITSSRVATSPQSCCE